MTAKTIKKHESTETTSHASSPPATHVKVASTPDGAFTSAGGSALGSIRTALTHIPGAAYLDLKQQRILAPRYTVDPRFLEAACTAVEASPELARLTKLDTVSVRNAIRMDAAFAPVEQEAQSLVDAIHGARVTTYAVAVDLADSVLKAARGLMSTSAKKEMGDHVARMNIARKQRRKTSARASKKRSTAVSSAAAHADSTPPAADATTAASAAKTTTVTTMTA